MKIIKFTLQVFISFIVVACSVVNSERAMKIESFEDLKTRIDFLTKSRNEEYNKLSNIQSSVVFAGDTGSGKSTLVNFLSQVELSCSMDAHENWQIDVKGNPKQYCPIGNDKFASKTIDPNCMIHISEKKNMLCGILQAGKIQEGLYKIFTIHFQIAKFLQKKVLIE